MSQGLALAILAWLQTLPGSQWSHHRLGGGKDPRRSISRSRTSRADPASRQARLASRLLRCGLLRAPDGEAQTGSRSSSTTSTRSRSWASSAARLVRRDLWKGSLGVGRPDPVALLLRVPRALLRLPPRKATWRRSRTFRGVEVGAAPGPGRRGWAITGIFVVGGLMLIVSAHAFVESMLALAIAAGASPFVFVQWVAPFLSGSPKLSAFNGPGRSRGADGRDESRLLTINQWSILSALIPSSIPSRGDAVGNRLRRAPARRDPLTLMQSFLGWLLLVNLDLRASRRQSYSSSGSCSSPCRPRARRW